MTIDFKALMSKVKETAPDMTKPQSGGGEYVPPAAGRVQMRFVGYVEIGKHAKTVKGVTKTQPRAVLTFELSGPKHPPKEDGTPQLISIEENVSLNEKANFFKLFTRLNYAGDATHIAELLGRAYLGTIYHRTYKGSDGKDRIAAELRAKGEAYSIEPPRFQHPVSGEYEVVPVAEAKSPLRCFLWDYADMAQWASIFIEGEYPARTNEAGEVTMKAKSKNILQNKIKLATNFNGSPVHQLLVAAGGKIDIPDVDSVSEEGAPEDDSPAEQQAPAQSVATPTGAEATDALNGIV